MIRFLFIILNLLSINSEKINNSILIDNLYIPIVEVSDEIEGQERINEYSFEWIDWTSIYTDEEKTINSDNNLYLAADRNNYISRRIFDVDSVYFVDKNGERAKYVKHFESEVFNSKGDIPDDFVVSLMQGFYNENAIVFQVCTDMFANAKYIVFIKEE